MQPKITQTNRVRPAIRGPMEIGLTLTERVEYKHILPAVLDYLGRVAVEPSGSHRPNAMKRQAAAERIAEIELFRQDIAARPQSITSRSFDLSADEAEGATAYLTGFDPRLPRDVQRLRHELGFKISRCRGPLVQEYYMTYFAVRLDSAGSAPVQTDTPEPVTIPS